MRRAVLLDRDGVINAMVYHAEFGLVDSPSNPTEFRLIPGVASAVRRINDMGFLAIVISNQPGVAKGKFTLDLLQATKDKMHRELARQGAKLDGVYYCLHHPDAELDDYRQMCECRKPKAGLLLQAAVECEFDLEKSYFVGDGITDVLAGNTAGCKTILVNGRKCYLCDELERQQTTPDFIAKDLADAVQLIGQLESGYSEAKDKYGYHCRLGCNDE